MFFKGKTLEARYTFVHCLRKVCFARVETTFYPHETCEINIYFYILILFLLFLQKNKHWPQYSILA